MLLKIQKTRVSAEWVIFDNVKNVSYRSYPHTFGNEKELRDVAGQPCTSTMTHEGLFPPTDGDSTPFFGEDIGVWYCLNEVTFIHNDDFIRILFDGAAFLCNDEGKTIQKFTSAGLLLGTAKASIPDAESPAQKTA